MTGADWTPKLVWLAEPRDLRTSERQYLEFLLKHPESVAALGVQAETVKVVSECDCGCHSVGLEPESSAPVARARPETHTYGDGNFEVAANGCSAAGHEVSVRIHVVNGHMVELEIWGGPLREDGRAVGEVPVLDTLSYSS